MHLLTLSPQIQEMYDNVLNAQQPHAAWGIIEHFFKEYDIAETNADLWLLLGSALTSNQPPHINEVEERQHLVTFYEHLKALVLATQVLHKQAIGGRLPLSVEELKIKHGEDNSIQNVVDFIVTTIHPESIFRVPYSNTTLLDLIIVMPKGGKTTFKHYERIIEIAGIRKNGFQFSLHHSPEFIKKLENGSSFYTAVCCEENRLYSNGNEHIPTPTKESRIAQAEQAEKSFTNGHSKAFVFMDGAKLYLDKEQYTMAAFMLHQSIERCLLATIAATTGTTMNTHIISELLQHTRRYAWELNEVFPANTEWERSFLQWVDKLYADAGYKDGFETPPEYIDILLDRTNKILERSHELIARLFIK